MPRQMRREFAGAIYHVMNRGDRREAIFRNDQDRRMFLSTLTGACAKTGWQIHAYCLMRNHFHLVIETPQPTLVVGMKWLLGVYTKRFNIRHKECGHLFAGLYKALHVEGKGDERKVRLAARLRKDTTMSLKWIAQNLAMGSWTHVSNLLVAERKRESLKSEN